jgi:hypothetical protein
LASHLKSWDIKPAGDNGTYEQCFDQGYTEFHELGSLELHVPKEDGTVTKKSYQFPKEFFPGGNTGSGTITAEVVYVGYGTTAPEHQYDDYADIDVKGKIVMLNRDVPSKDSKNPEFKKWAKYCYHNEKIKNAVSHGAVGLIYIDGTHANPNITHVPGFLVAGIGKDAQKDLLADTNLSNEKILEKIIKTKKPNSFSTGKTVTMSAKTTWHPGGKACNVIGYLKGKDPVLKEEVIIIGGHYDGQGNYTTLLPGALDNATGTIDILATAKAMARSKIPLKRSVVFIFISGEEVGLVGSRLYVKKPLFPKEKTVIYINLDMVGNGTGFSIRGGETYPGISKFFANANEKYLKRPFKMSPKREYYGRPRSDGHVFKRAGYRVFGMGLSDWNKPVNYHLPTDHVDLTVDPIIMEDVTNLLFVSLTNLARAERIDLD